MGALNVTCSNQMHLVYVWAKRYIYLYALVYVTKFVLESNGIELVIAVIYHSNHVSSYHVSAYSPKKDTVHKSQ